MMQPCRTKLIACATIVEEAAPFLSEDVECHSMEASLHHQSKKLHGRLQDIINKETGRFDTIIIGYGRCSKAAIGLRAESSTLIVPRVDDCIAMFLGSQQRYRKLMAENIGTYYLSPGWIKAGATLVEELERIEKKYGRQNAEFIKHEMLKHYTSLAFIDMGYDDQQQYYAAAQDAAQKLNLTYKTIKGTTAMIQQLLYGPWDDAFIVAPPGRVITYADFE